MAPWNVRTYHPLEKSRAEGGMVTFTIMNYYAVRHVKNIYCDTIHYR